MSFPRGFTLQAQAVGPAGATAAAAQVSVPAIPGAAPVVTAVEAQLWTPRWSESAQQPVNLALSLVIPAIAGVRHVVTDMHYHYGVWLVASPWGGGGVYMQIEVQDGASVIVEDFTADYVPVYTATQNYPYNQSCDWSGRLAGTAGNSMTFGPTSGVNGSFTGYHHILGQGFDVTAELPQIEWSPDGGTTWNGLGTLQTPDFSDYSYSGELFGTPDLALDVAFSAPVAPNQTQTLVVQGYYV